MFLSRIFPPEAALSPELSELTIGKPCIDSRLLQKKDVFFSENGASYVMEALEKGASAIVSDVPLPPLPIPVILTRDVKLSYALAWQRMTDHPERDITLIAVTGTNGKSSVLHFLSHILRRAGIPHGRIGTLSYFDGKTEIPADYTTPPPEILYPLLQRMRENGIRYAIMEASSQALAQKRLAGLTFDIAVFTNLTRDHLDYHGTFEQYRAAKAILFQNAKRAVIFSDDKNAKNIAFEAAGDVYYYGTKKDIEFQILSPESKKTGISYQLKRESDTLSVSSPAVGSFQIANTTAAIACASLLDIPREHIINALSDAPPPAGRLEKCKAAPNFDIYIDYAHTPDALFSALSSLRPLTDHLTVIFGAGGDRDREKRPQMGAIADRLADRILLTNDNPRSEDPEAILSDIQKGIKEKPTLRIPDRKEAIEYALETAKAGEILLVAGKGHETYLIDRDGRHPFSERAIIDKYLERKGQKNVSQHE